MKSERKETTTKSRTHQNTWRVGKLQVFRNIINSYYQKSRDKKKFLNYPRRTRKLLETKRYSRNLIKRSKKHQGGPSCNLHWTLLKMDKRGTQTIKEQEKWCLYTKINMKETI